MTPIRIVPRSDEEARLWLLTEEVAGVLAGVPWVLIGGQMVEVLEREAGGGIGRRTGDVDVLVDLRAETSSLRVATDRLAAAGFDPQLTPDGLTYRFIRGDDVVDLLAPDNLGERANLTTAPPGVTLGVPGGTQALRRSRQVVVEVSDRTFVVPVPTLVGALVIKAHAALASSRDIQRRRHLRDLARLLVIVADPETLRADLSGKERLTLQRLRPLEDPAHEAWTDIPGSVDAIIALRRLSDQDD